MAFTHIGMAIFSQTVTSYYVGREKLEVLTQQAVLKLIILNLNEEMPLLNLYHLKAYMEYYPF